MPLLVSYISARKRRKMELMSSETLSKAKTHKSRLSKENQDVEIRLYYDERGLDRYYGLLELGELGGLWKNVAGVMRLMVRKSMPKRFLKVQKSISPKK
jgi:hypothetical protein